MSNFTHLIWKAFVLAFIIMICVQKTFATKYSSSSVTQVTTIGTAPGATDVQILRVDIVGGGGGGTWGVDQIGFTMQNTDNANITKARAYWTTTSTFSNADPYGNEVSNPSGAIVFSEQYLSLASATYYIWLVFDISAGAPSCTNTVDAFVTASSLVITPGSNGAGSYTPTNNNPAGNRLIEGIGCWTYCTPSYTSATEPICQVIFNTINNSSSCVVGGSSYEDYTSISTTISSGFYYAITVYGNTNGNFTNMINVFFDWNNNGDFTDAGEETQIGTITNCANCAVSGSIAVPAGATLGTTRMRVMKKWNAYSTSCGTGAGYGQAEDYEIVVTSVAHCINSVQDADETGVDCGGADCFAPVAGSVTGGASYACGSGNYTLTLSGYSGSIMWQYSTDGSTWYDMYTSTSATLTGTVNQTTYFRAKVYGGNCSPVYTTVGAGSTVTITGSITATWDGSSSTDWGTAANWDNNAVPTSCTDVIIPNVTNDPVVTGSSVCKNLIIDGGILIVDLSGSNTFIVNGDFIVKNGGSLRHDHTTANTTSSSNDLISLAGKLNNIDMTGGSFTVNASGYWARIVIKTNANYFLQSDINPYFFRNEPTSSISFNSYTFLMSEGGRFDQDASTSMMYANTGTFENQGGDLLAFPAALAWQEGTFYTNYQSSSVTNNLGADNDWYNYKMYAVPPFVVSIGSSGSVGNNFEIVTGGTVLGNSYVITVGKDGSGSTGPDGDFINNGTFTQGTSTVIMAGDVSQEIRGTSSTTFNNLTINNNISGNGGVTASANVTVNGVLTLTDGHLISPASGRLTLGASATVSPITSNKSGSSASFVSGYLDRVINTTSEWPFPMGISAQGLWRPLSIKPSDATSRTWTVQSVNSNPLTDYGSTIKSGELLTSLYSAYYYNISQSPATGTVDLKLWYEESDLGGLAEADVHIGHWCTPAGSCGGSTWWDNWGKNAGGDWNRDATDNWVQVLSVSSFSPIGRGGKGAGLPIELLSFNAYPAEDIVQLNWSTANEINNNYFTIERSVDGKDFVPVVEKIPSKAPGGISSEQLDYSDKDGNPYKEVSYYRLKQTDFDGRYSYSNTVAVNLKEGVRNLYVYPNPAKNKLHIVIGEKGNFTVKIYDITGQIVSHSVICSQPSPVCDIDISNLSEGVYFVSLTDGNDIRYARFVKE